MRVILTERQIKDKPIQDFFKNEKILDMIAEIAIKTILENREDALIQCGNKFRHLTGIKKSSNTAILIFSAKEIGKVCQGSPESVIHFHGPYLSTLSNEDKQAHSVFFNAGVKFGCAVGVDGFSCQTPHSFFRVYWDKPFFDKLREYNIPVWENVDSVFCYGGKNKLKECNLSFMDESPSWANKFNEVIAEQQFGEIPYMWYSKSSIMPDIEINSPFSTSQICVTPFTNNKDRVLTCFPRISD